MGGILESVLKRPEGVSRRSAVTPFLLGLIAFTGLVLVPWATQRNIARVQASALDTIAPARTLVTHVQYELALELAGSRGYLLTGEQRYVDEYWAARRTREADIQALLSLTAEDAPEIFEMVQGLEARLQAANEATNELLAGRLSREAYVARLPEQQAIFQGALEEAALISNRLSAATAANRFEIERISRRAAWVVTGLVVLAVIAALATGLLGLRLRQLASRLERYGAKQSALREAARALAEVGSVKEAAAIIAAHAARDTRSGGAFVERALEPSPGGIVEVVASEGSGGPPIGTRVPYPGSLSEEVIESGEPRVETGPGATGEPPTPYLSKTCHGCTGMVVPLVSEGTVLGAMVMLREAGAPSYSSEDTAVARALGDTASAALRRVLLIEELRESKRRFRLVTDHLHQMIWLGTPDLSERYFVNPACKTIFGVEPEEFLRDPRTVPDPIHPEDRERRKAALRAIPDRPYDERYRIVRRDGQVRWIWSRIYPIPEEEGEVSLAAGILEDITEAHAAQAERERLLARESAALARSEEARAEAVARKEALEKVTRSRAHLIRGFTHDLKNPLGAADGFLQLLERHPRDPLTAGQRQRVAKARKSLHAALDMIEGLVALSQAEGGRLEIERRNLDLGAVAAQLAEQYRAQAAAAGLELIVDMPGGKVEVHSDPAKIRQVLGNLLSNAVKYTDHGRITVQVAREGAAAAVRVIDTGRGIAPEEQTQVFEEFRRAKSAAGERGSGIGLAISRAIARALGGDITLESEVGEGSTFTLWLPVELTSRHADEHAAHP